jgi:hypothetical protein
MKLNWLVEPCDVEQVKALIDQHKDDPFVKARYRWNVRDDKPKVEKADFGKQMVACLLTTRQRSGPQTVISRFTRVQPFPLAYDRCIAQEDIRAFANQELTAFGGIWRAEVISDQIMNNLKKLEGGFWDTVQEALEHLRLQQDMATERATADSIDGGFVGFGPKQSRNLLQCVGLTRYEIPIDSRITDWLNDFGSPVHLSADALGDRDYYCFVLDGIQELCRVCGILPCILDASIFVSFDNGGWTEEIVHTL